jgi:hypothetical protein
MQNGLVEITKELFIETIDEIKKQHENDSKCTDAFSVILPTDFISGYDNHWIQNQLLKIIKISLNDFHKDSWIEYFIYDLDFGKEYKKGMTTNVDGSEIDLSDSGKLYDFLITNI